jgi:hypothetical protein
MRGERETQVRAVRAADTIDTIYKEREAEIGLHEEKLQRSQRL